MQNNLKLHHIGVATRNIDKEFEAFSKLGYKKCSEILDNAKQKITQLSDTGSINGENND